MTTTTELCPCGRPLHYADPADEEFVRKMVRTLGPTIPVCIDGVGSWAVPRHYIALHGIKAWELPEIAKRYGFKEISG